MMKLQKDHHQGFQLAFLTIEKSSMRKLKRAVLNGKKILPFKIPKEDLYENDVTRPQHVLQGSR